MPTVAEPADRRAPELLVDTSVAVALLVSDHDHHDGVIGAIGARRLGLAGHAAFETFSVLTRLPAPARRESREVGRLIESNFPATRWLGAKDMSVLLARLSDLGIAGGSVYDALVGAVAATHGVRLATRDVRALEIYRALDVEVELLD